MVAASTLLPVAAAVALCLSIAPAKGSVTRAAAGYAASAEHRRPQGGGASSNDGQSATTTSNSYTGRNCLPTNATCWPTAADVAALNSGLSNGTRALRWYGPGTPKPCSVPDGSANGQPLYGVGWNGLPKVDTTSTALLANETELCAQGSPTTNGGCFSALRNNPLRGWKPGFTIWALTASDVQLGVTFAIRHELCLSVAGPGHDFINRHSCPTGGVLIRTTLMKDSTFLPDVGVHGAFRFQPGLTFSDAHYFAAQNNRVVSSGWASTVGIIGWAIGGGHGPLAPGYGLGVDNILEAEIVTAPEGKGAGNVVTVNATHNSDLYAAIRGGGGSTWGVIVSVTVTAHPIPDGGFTVTQAATSGGFCDNFENADGLNGVKALEGVAQHIFDWMQGLDTDFGGLVWAWAERSDVPEHCGANWTVYTKYAFLGPLGSGKRISAFANLTAGVPGVAPSMPWGNSVNYANWFEFVDPDLEPIYPWPWLYGTTEKPIGGLPSALVSRDKFVAGGGASDVMMTFLKACASGGSCHRMELYQDITGNVGSPQPADHNSLSPAMRSAMVHWIAGSQLSAAEADVIYSLSNYSYFGESANLIFPTTASTASTPAWAERLWGSERFSELTQTKSSWDPASRFWCHYCVGDTAEF